MKSIEQEIQEIEQKKKMQKLVNISLQEPEELYNDLLEGMDEFMKLFKEYKNAKTSINQKRSKNYSKW